jgi:hypothetical protein
MHLMAVQPELAPSLDLPYVHLLDAGFEAQAVQAVSSPAQGLAF